jgi:hypothetical protein
MTAFRFGELVLPTQCSRLGLERADNQDLSAQGTGPALSRRVQLEALLGKPLNLEAPPLSGVELTKTPLHMSLRPSTNAFVQQSAPQIQTAH